MSGWIQAVLVVAALALLATFMAQMPTVWVNGFRLFNGFAILTLLAWIIRRVLKYEDFLRAHRDDILEVFQTDHDQREAEYQALIRRTDELEQRLNAEEGRA